jgi:hypothetical protein
MASLHREPNTLRVFEEVIGAHIAVSVGNDRWPALVPDQHGNLRFS